MLGPIEASIVSLFYRKSVMLITLGWPNMMIANTYILYGHT